MQDGVTESVGVLGFIDDWKKLILWPEVLVLMDCTLLPKGTGFKRFVSRQVGYKSLSPLCVHTVTQLFFELLNGDK